MFDPYRCLRQAFSSDFFISLSPVREDGSRLLALYAPGQAPIKRRLSAGDWQSPAALRRMIRSVHFGLAIDRGQALLWLAGLDWQVKPDAVDRSVCAVRGPAKLRGSRRP